MIAPKDRAVGLSAAVIKVASGAADSVPYIAVTNLARTLRELKERNIWVVGADSEAKEDLYSAQLPAALAWVLGAEGEGMRRLTRETCDQLVRIPDAGAGRKPQRLGGERGGPVRVAPPALGQGCAGADRA